VLFYAGDQADSGYLIQEGSFRLKPGGLVDRPEIMAGPGVLLGELALLSATTRPATATARGPSAVIRISRSLFLKTLQNYPDAAHRLHQRRAGGGDFRVVLAGDETLARPGRQVDDHVDAAVADALDHLAVMRQLHARPSVIVAHVDVGDGRAGLGGLDAGRRDLLRRAWQAGVLLERCMVAGHCDAENGFLGHAGCSRSDVGCGYAVAGASAAARLTFGQRALLSKYTFV
jgi:hypothetical protein